MSWRREESDMRIYACCIELFLAALIVGHASGAVADGKQPAKPPSKPRVVYAPPTRGAPAARTSAGTRGPEPLPRIYVLAPDHVGLTTSAQPTLAWFAAGSAEAPVMLTILRDGDIDPLLEVQVAPTAEAGLHEVSLARWNVALEEGVTYQWYLSLTPDREHPDRAGEASGGIARVAPSRELAAALAGDAPAYVALAQHGIWYDAVAELDRRIDSGDESLRSERAALLQQVGLGDVAAALGH
jgi:uncharacterized protein DUF928